MSTDLSDPPPIVSTLSRRRSSAAATTSPRDDGDTCRICRGEASPEQPLFYPCKCSGSIRYVHQDCLMEWLSHSQKKHCELCKTPFRFTKLYDKSMPENVPLPLFAQKMAIYTVKALTRYVRYAIVLFIWLAWLPWTIRQVWRALFWLADGSWLPPHDVAIAANADALNGSNITSASNLSALAAHSNVTLLEPTGMDGIGFMRLLIMLTGLISPATLLRFIADLVAQMFVVPAVRGEPVRWERAFLFAPLPRPPSLLSDLTAVASITNMPIVNNAVVDVLEGQLICLAVVASFILVFLIREWVINQQPLLNMPDQPAADQQPAAPLPDPPQGVRRRRRAFRNVLEDRPGLPGQGAAVMEGDRQPPRRPRRRATDNNILAPTGNEAMERPALPQRAASLVPALDEWEANARELENLWTPQPSQMIESPPLDRGFFGEVGQIQRSIEESRGDTGNAAAEDSDSGDAQFDASVSPGIFSVHDRNDAMPINEQQAHASDLTSDEPASPSTRSLSSPQSASESDKDSVSSAETTSLEEDLLTPQGSSADELGQADSAQPDVHELLVDGQIVHDGHPQATHTGHPVAEAAQEATQNQPVLEPDNIWTRLSKWLWDTEDFVPGAPPPRNPDEETEIIADVDAGAQPAIGADADAAPRQGPQVVPPNIQNGVNINDPNAVDEAEDIEGVLELIGMEGPIAGMIQNLIFSVFLITLTLSASVWCPYIWGKIALLFIAHPISVFFKAPLYLLSRFADFVVDTGLFVLGLTGVALNYLVLFFHSTASILSPNFGSRIQVDFIGRIASKLSRESGSRIERMVTNTLLGFRPDLPTFSIQSHHVLRVFNTKVKNTFTAAGAAMAASELSDKATNTTQGDIFTALIRLPSYTASLPISIQHGLREIWHEFVQLQHDLRPLSLSNTEEIDLSLAQWSAKEKIICVLLGYLLFTVAGLVYTAAVRWTLKLRPEEKVPGFLAETLGQAGGVMKVVVIIGIEMIVFPLFCGTMLDIALLPMFENATIYSRLRFFANAPFTALFIHWFVGTCYMFHFALFVSMCRKVMRKGVLYFIRDPDDPSFHPVRDVLERPVATQLGKIALSAFVYGSLLLICLGGMVATLKRINHVLPFRWGSLDPAMVIPGDIIYYNFMLPFILQKVDVSNKISALFSWWFRACAGGLRLSDFFFGVDNEEEKVAAAVLWRRFFKLLWSPEKPKKHPMVQHVEDLDNDRDRLVWCKHTSGSVDDPAILTLFPGTQFTIIPLIDDKSQALVHFNEKTDVEMIRKIIDDHSRNGNTEMTLSKVKDMKIVTSPIFNAARKTVVDQKAGSYVRAPAKDSARIPKGNNVFLKVDEDNNRLDQQPDLDEGLHGRKDERFGRIFIPNHFRARVTTFVLLVWFFTAGSGLTIAIGPLVIGRAVFHLLLPHGRRLSDLYAYTLGAHILAAGLYMVQSVQKRRKTRPQQSLTVWEDVQRLLPRVQALVIRCLGILYLLVTVGILAPLLLALLCEVYVNIPIFMFLTRHSGSPDKPANAFISTMSGTGAPLFMHLVQTWAAGLIYLRVLIHVLRRTADTDTRPAAAMRAILRDGILRPQIRLATRALILPVTVVSAFLLTFPASLAYIVMLVRKTNDQESLALYRASYPCLLMFACVVYVIFRLRDRVAHWRIRVRDEIYLVGERLHNLPATEERQTKPEAAPNPSQGTTAESKSETDRSLIDEERNDPHGSLTRASDDNADTQSATS